MSIYVKDANAYDFNVVEVYPFEHNENHAYHGVVSMYKIITLNFAIKSKAIWFLEKFFERQV